MQTLVDWLVGAIPELIAVAAAVAAGSVILAVIRSRKMPIRAAIAATLPDAAMGLIVALILVLTLRPGPQLEGERTTINLVPFREQFLDWTRRSGPLAAIAEVVGNVAVFVPLGGAVAWRFERLRRRHAAIGFVAFSLAIEVTQLLIGERRTADITDVLLNPAGAMIGFELWRAWRGGPVRSARRGRTGRSP
jgi:glycopeptide antibiotics resistance protein